MIHGTCIAIHRYMTDMDRIVTRHTAFASWIELSEHMARGYVPTLHREFAKPLISLLTASGMPFFPVGLTEDQRLRLAAEA